jgi:two-component system cell cycle response regulator DivK
MPTVLIVDDNDKNLKLARDLLRRAGFRTVVATSGTEAIELAAGHAPDVILMDLRLPDMTGTDAARRIADLTGTAHIPVVAMSAAALEGGDEWLERAGFDGWIEKPIVVGTFANRVRGFCLGND